MYANRTKTWVILSLAVLFLFLIPGINHGLWRPDEPRVAGTCAEMARTGDYVVPYLNGEPFLEKPPLYYAAAAVAGSL
ncbi:MAG TPA: glycosyltransferase family 39 protein, partial [Deltaproteobacteria bacterium]|nr:glycosyltransferase family 39 protein [Deltaproteobacteria bacterium]